MILHRDKVYGLGGDRLALWSVNGHCKGRKYLARARTIREGWGQSRRKANQLKKDKTWPRKMEEKN